MKKIILASASPRRKELLGNLNLDFDIIPADIEENIDNKNFIPAIVEELALQKAQAVAVKLNESAVVIGSDTVVQIKGKVLGKPTGRQDAYNMLKMLSNNTHQVISAIAIIDIETNKQVTDYVTSNVTFKELNDSEIETYLDMEEPYDKAGSYALQGYGSALVKSVNGCFTNVIGISTYKLAEMLKEFDIYILEKAVNK